MTLVSEVMDDFLQDVEILMDSYESRLTRKVMAEKLEDMAVNMQKNERLKKENKRLKKEYEETSRMVDKIINNEECVECRNLGSFPSPACCKCVFDSIKKMADYMDEKCGQQSLKLKS